MKDRYVNGLAAGLLGGIAMSILNLISYYVFGIAELLYLDWAAVMIFGYTFATLSEAIIGQIGQLFFASIVGILFAYLIPLTPNVQGWL